MGLVHSCFFHDISYGQEFGRGEGQLEKKFSLRDRQVDFSFLTVPSLADPYDNAAEVGVIPCRREPGSRVFIFANFLRQLPFRLFVL